MYSKNKKSLWYGSLKTSKSNSIVIFDPSLPSAPTGKVFLFNSQRDDFVQYVEDIVSKNLHDLDADELKEAQNKYSAAFKKAQRNFLAKHSKPEPSDTPVKNGLLDEQTLSELDEDDLAINMDDDF